MDRLTKYILDENGEPQPCDDVVRWGEWFEASCRNGSRNIARSMVGSVMVSTVFLALDHSFSDSGPPVLWETMIFGGWCDQWCRRATSKGGALQNHVRALRLARRYRWLPLWLRPAIETFERWYRLRIRRAWRSLAGER